MNDLQIKYLMDIGLSKLQAKVYITLLLEPNLTGYKIAKILNEPVANSYKALDVLISKGLAMLDDTGNNKLYSVIPISAYLNQLESTFSSKRKIIEEEFKKIKTAKVQERFFKIENKQQLYEITFEMIRNAKEILAIDCTPVPLEIFKPHLQKIAKRGVKVLIKSYSEIDIPNCDIICFENMETESNKLIQFFNISNPGIEYTSALLNKDNTEIIEAINSKSKYLSFMAYSGITSEFTLTKLLAELNQGKTADDLLKSWEKFDYLRPTKVGAIQDYFKSI